MTSLHAALIVDADPKGLEALTYGFQGADWRTTACPTPETASLLVKASGAEIVVIVSRVDHDKTLTLIRQIRSKEAFRTLPLLVLGPEELRKSLKKDGDVDLLPLPAFVRDVLTASQLLVEAGASAARKPGEEPSYSLPITAANTLSMIRTLCGLARSGLLQLGRKGRHGELLFHEGELTAAQVVHLQGMAAVQHVLIWNDGELKLYLRPVVRRGQLHQSAQEFLEELDRFQRDFTHAMKDIGPPATVYSFSEGRLQHTGNSVPAEVTPVVRLCDGQRMLSDIIDESPFRVLDTVRIVGRLVELAILIRRDPNPDSGVNPGRPPLEEFWETARIVGPTTPRTVRARGDGNKTPTPEAGTPTIPATRGEGNASDDEKGHKRRKTLEIVTTSGRTPGAEPIPVAAMPSPSPFSPVPKMVVPGTQTSGTIDPSEQQPQSTVPDVPDRTFVVVDAVQIEVAKTPESAIAQSSVLSNPAPQGPVIQAPIVQNPMAQGPVILPPTAQNPSSESSAASSGARITGEIQVAPSRKTARQMPVAARMSIQLDATLAPVPDTASTSAPSASASPVVQQNSVRVTGEIKVVPSGRATRDAGRLERVSSSFQIDPSLTVEASAEAKGSPTSPSGDRPLIATPEQGKRQSGHFSPLEKDFFEREAELYKVDNAESFADLDENRDKVGNKNGSSKKPGRPNHK